MKHRTTRREFLAKTSIGGFSVLLGARGIASAYTINEKLQVGVIGVANRGRANLDGVSGESVAALCDIDDSYLDEAARSFPSASRCNDFRRLLEQRDIDAVTVSTPDHTHAVATLAALRAGKHVYCEKPLARTVGEVRAIRETARKLGRVTQMGTQIHAGGNYRRVVELVKKGAIGAVRKVHVWCGKSWGGGERPAHGEPVPSHIHYDLWLGPAPYRPYSKRYLPAEWRRWWDFGGGTLADMGCHHIDLPFWALELRAPLTAKAEGPEPDAETAPAWSIITWEFGARGEMPPVTLRWYDGGRRPALFAEGRLPRWGDGTLFVGDEGLLIADYGDHRLLPEKEFSGYVRPDPFIPDSIGHHAEWIAACKDGRDTTCNFDYSGALTESVLLGNVAYRAGTKLEWDADSLRVKNHAEANRLVEPDYREGWSL